MDAHYETGVEDLPVKCDMHWRDKPYYIQPGEPVHYRMLDDEYVDSVACENCALHFKWDSSDWQHKTGYWGPEGEKHATT